MKFFNKSRKTTKSNTTLTLWQSQVHKMCKLTGLKTFQNISILNEFHLITKYPELGTEHSVFIATTFF